MPDHYGTRPRFGPVKVTIVQPKLRVPNAGVFATGSYSTDTVLPNIDLPAYRADSKEEFAVDVAYAAFRAGVAVATGGIGAAARTTLGLVSSLLG